MISGVNENKSLKTKFIRGNSKSHCNKVLRKAIMKRSRLNGLANKTQNSINIKNFKKQWNILLKSNKTIKRNNMNSLNPKTESKPF